VFEAIAVSINCYQVALGSQIVFIAEYASDAGTPKVVILGIFVLWVLVRQSKLIRYYLQLISNNFLMQQESHLKKTKVGVKAGWNNDYLKTILEALNIVIA